MTRPATKRPRPFRRLGPAQGLALPALLLAVLACGDDAPAGATSAAGGGSAGSASTTTTTGDGGGGGEGGQGGCSGDADCTEPGAAKCDGGSCVACDDSSQCAGILGAEVCHEGTCVECSAADESACSDTCDLLENTCTDAPAGTLRTARHARTTCSARRATAASRWTFRCSRTGTIAWRRRARTAVSLFWFPSTSRVSTASRPPTTAASPRT